MAHLPNRRFCAPEQAGILISMGDSVTQSRASALGNLRAIGLILFSGLAVIAMNIAIRRIADGLHPFEIAFFRNVFGFLVLLPLIWRAGGFGALKTQRLGLHALRGVFNTVGMLAFFMALTLAPLAEVTALSFTSPLFAMLGAALVLGERAGPRRWAGLIIGFIGMLIILRPGFEIVGTGAILTVGSSAAWACAMLTIKVLARSERSLVITAYAAVSVALLTFPAALLYWRWPTLEEYGMLVVIGLFGSLAQLSLSQAFREADASVVLPFDFRKLIWSSLFGFLFFSEVPDIWTWLGGSVIFASGCYIAYRERVRRGETVSGSPATGGAD